MKDVRCLKCSSVLQVGNSHINFRCPVCRHETVTESDLPVYEACYTHVSPVDDKRELKASLVTLTVDTLTAETVHDFEIFEVRSATDQVGYVCRIPGEADEIFSWRVWLAAQESALIGNMDDAVFIGISCKLTTKLQGV